MMIYFVEAVEIHSWEYSSHTVGVFDSLQAAEEAKRKIIAQIETEKSRYSKGDIERLEALSDEPSEFWSKETRDYVNWFTAEWHNYQGDYIFIREYELNKINLIDSWQTSTSISLPS